jgi:hypothetical protein
MTEPRTAALARALSVVEGREHEHWETNTAQLAWSSNLRAALAAEGIVLVDRESLEKAISGHSEADSHMKARYSFGTIHEKRCVPAAAALLAELEKQG